MLRSEVQSVLDVLQEAVDRSGRSRRNIESAMGFSHGYLNHLFGGRIQLKLEHIFLLGDELGFDGWAFLHRVSGPPSRSAEAPALPPGGLSADAVARMIRSELERRGVPAPPEPEADAKPVRRIGRRFQR